MKFLLLVYGYGDTGDTGDTGDAPEVPLREDARVAAIGAGEWLDGAAVAHPVLARTVVVRDGAVDTRGGPAARGARLAGFWVVDCADADRAVALAAGLPAGPAVVEVRPLMAPSGLEM